MSDEKRPYESETKGHVWETEEDGTLDIFAYEGGNSCNGPACSICGYGFCHHCHKLPLKRCSGDGQLKAKIKHLRAELDDLERELYD